MIGIIGGTGLYQMDELQIAAVKEVTTPFGDPSSSIVVGILQGQDVAFLARHGVNHDLLPSEINYRGNVWALKALGVRTILSVSAVGSLREDIRPGDLAVPSQYIDLTKGLRAGTFFGRGLVAHVSTAHPTCEVTASLVARSARSLELALHEGRTYACIEGPRFGTRAESLWLRETGADLVGMTNVPEAFLACEAQVGYCTIAVVTDYDCWLEGADQHVSVAQVNSLFRQNLERVQQLIGLVVQGYVEDETRPCRSRLASAIITPRERMRGEQRAIVDFLSG
jgi:5'-methylthioadenosine phosphorylase